MTPFLETIFAGTPAITEKSGKFFVTTALAPIATLFPILTFPTIFTPGPIYTLSPMTGYPLFFPLLASPSVTP